MFPFLSFFLKQSLYYRLAVIFRSVYKAARFHPIVFLFFLFFGDEADLCVRLCISSVIIKNVAFMLSLIEPIFLQHLIHLKTENKYLITADIQLCSALCCLL